MFILYKIKYIIHGNSVIILTQFFEPCYITTHEVYLVGFINFRKKKFSSESHAAHKILRLCVLCILVSFTDILIPFLRHLYRVKIEHLVCSIDYCKIKTKIMYPILRTYRQHSEMHFHVHRLWNSHKIL
jgi:hypothetical protein